MAAITTQPAGTFDVTYFVPPEPAPPADLIVVANSRAELDDAVATLRLGIDEKARRRARARRQRASRKRNR